MRQNQRTQLLSLLLSLSLTYSQAFAALSGGMVFEFRTTATAGMVNGGGFNSVRGGTDYSLQDTAQITASDLNTVTISSTATSASALFTSAMVGNVMNITTTGTGAQCIIGWYEIVSFVNSTTIVLDRDPSQGTGCVNSTFNVGGALSLNSALDSTFFTIVPASSTIYFKAGNYTAGQAINNSSATCTSTNACYLEGYNTTRGDNPTLQSRPLINMGANAWTTGTYFNFANIQVTGTPNAMFATGTGPKVRNCSILNLSATAGRSAATMAIETSFYFDEVVSLNGQALNMGNNGNKAVGCFIHDSDTGITSSAARITLIGNVIAGNKTVGWTNSSTTGSHVVYGNTWYGSEAKISTGIVTSANVPDMGFFNNIVYGFQTGIKLNLVQTSNYENYNDFFNNQTDRVNLSTGPNSIAVTPQFVNASQITGTNGSTSGSVLTDATKDFSVVVDTFTYLRVSNSTGGTLGQYQITSHTGTTITTNNALGTGSSVIYTVTSGNNFAIGQNLKADGNPGLLGYGTTSYLDIGAVQRREPTLAVIFAQ